VLPDDAGEGVAVHQVDGQVAPERAGRLPVDVPGGPVEQRQHARPARDRGQERLLPSLFVSFVG